MEVDCELPGPANSQGPADVPLNVGNSSSTLDFDDEDIIHETNALAASFQQGVNNEEDGEDEDEEEEDDGGDGELPMSVVAAGHEGLEGIEWVDEFILSARRKGGKNTENSVLKLYKVSVALFAIEKN